MTLSSPTNATISVASSVVTIGASGSTAEALPNIYMPPDEVVGESDGYVDLPITLGSPGESAVTVNWKTSDGTGSANTTLPANTPPASTKETLARPCRTGSHTSDRQDSDLQLREESDDGDLYLLLLDRFAGRGQRVRSSTQIDVVGDAPATTNPGLYVMNAFADNNSGTVDVPVVLGGPSGLAQGVPVTVDYKTKNGSAARGNGLHQGERHAHVCTRRDRPKHCSTGCQAI